MCIDKNNTANTHKFEIRQSGSQKHLKLFYVLKKLDKNGDKKNNEFCT